MTEKPSINDYSHSDFSSVREFEEWRKNAIAQLEAALTLIGDVAYDRDGYTGDAKKLGKLIDEIYGYARNPQTAVDTPEEGG